MLSIFDFIIKLNVDAREGLGEDSWCYAFDRHTGMIAAFDGCGGSGARKHESYSGHSEAFMASRLCAGAFYDGFLDSFDPRTPARSSGAASSIVKTRSAHTAPPAGRRRASEAP